ncbi:hypothetical protein CLV56_0105 [Mumia flava]|uniref:Uncharacterized protein n=1 Tax=Mumia flava TaxID=1348852 RepID=A0A0B2B913_9ACTN|nr:hypothetical protein [Mumia flava]PJJ55902.1 hypothetical protein CLV56_0105 [Mumia flava]
MEDDPAGASTRGTTYHGKRAAAPAARPPGPSWPFPTCMRFCAIPHEVEEGCQSFGEDVYLTLRGVDPETGEPEFMLVFPDQRGGPEVPLTAYQAAVLAGSLSPESLR